MENGTASWPIVARIRSARRRSLLVPGALCAAVCSACFTMGAILSLFSCLVNLEQIPGHLHLLKQVDGLSQIGLRPGRLSLVLEHVGIAQIAAGQLRFSLDLLLDLDGLCDSPRGLWRVRRLQAERDLGEYPVCQ